MRNPREVNNFARAAASSSVFKGSMNSGAQNFRIAKKRRKPSHQRNRPGIHGSGTHPKYWTPGGFAIR
jgi:hypothetical protein